MATTFEDQIGPRGGRIVTTRPPSAEVQAAQQRASRDVHSGALEPAIHRWNRENLAAEQLLDKSAEYEGLDFKPKNPRRGEPICFHRLINIFLGIRPSVEIARLRSDFVMKVCAEPWFRVAGATVHSGPVREVMTSAVYNLYEFLRDNEPVNGICVAELAELCEMDKDHLNEKRIEPEPAPTVQDLISGLTAALKAQHPAK